LIILDGQGIDVILGMS
jgi:hypothetical protein